VPQFFFIVFVCICLGGKTTKNIRKEMKTDFFSILKQNTWHFSLKKIKRGFKSSSKSSSSIIMQPKGG